MCDEEIFNVLVGKNIARMRAAHGLTQEEVARSLHVSLEEAQEYENGGKALAPAKPFQLARLFRCSIDDFCGDVRKPLYRSALNAPQIPQKVRFSEILAEIGSACYAKSTSV